MALKVNISNLENEQQIKTKLMNALSWYAKTNSKLPSKVNVAYKDNNQKKEAEKILTDILRDAQLRYFRLY